ncbi:hypothetical protein DMENIID0001_044450 [Sergentomyia squamirostris]
MTKSFESWTRVSRRKVNLSHSLTVDKTVEGQVQEMKEIRDWDLELPTEGQWAVYGHRLPEPILGKNFRLPPRGTPHLKPLMDTSLSYVRV